MLRRSIILILALLLLASPAIATDYYVRTDGSDSCNGLSNAGGSSGSCAFRSIERCNEVAGCGDTCNIGPGRFGEPLIWIEDACSDASPKTFRGSGQGTSWWMAALTDIDDASCTPSANPDQYTCPKPPGTVSNNQEFCLVEMQTDVVTWEDDNSVNGQMQGPVCLTWNTAGAATAASAPGTVYDAGSTLAIRSWDDQTPSTTNTDYWSPLTCGSTPDYGAIEIRGAHITIEDLSMVSGCHKIINVRDAGDHFKLYDVDIYTGMLWVRPAADHTHIKNVQVQNNYRRPVNKLTQIRSESWSTTSQSFSMQGGYFLIEDLHTYASREGAGFSGGAHDGEVNGGKFHGHHNHLLKVQDTNTHDILFTDIWTYNGQEPLFIQCPYNIEFRHSTFPFEHVLIQGDARPGVCGPGHPRNLDFHNNLLCGVMWMEYGGDTWAKGGHDLDYNVYLTDHAACHQNAWIVRNIAANRSFTTLSSWQGWSASTCSECTRDPHSTTDTVANTWIRYNFENDDLDSPYDFHLKDTTNAIDAGSSIYSDGIDADGKSRIGAPDAGAYENQQASQGGDPCGETPSGHCVSGQQPLYCNDAEIINNCDYCGCPGIADECNPDGTCGICEPAAEVCDGIDNDCDGDIDEGFDGDGDTYFPQESCSGYAAYDCDDDDPTINPGEDDICGNGIDEDCSGSDAYCACTEELVTTTCDCHGEIVSEGYCCQSGPSQEPCPLVEDVATFREGQSGYSGTEDAEIRGGEPDTNIRPAIYTRVGQIAIGDYRKILIRFSDIFGDQSPQIPLGAAIANATLHYYQEMSSTTSDIDIYKVTRSWDVDQATYNSYTTGNAWSQPGLASADRAQTPTDTLRAGVPHYLFDVTQDVQAWSDGETNNGWLIEIMDVGAYADARLISSQRTESPWLEVLYTTGGAGDHCTNGVQDADETGIDCGGADCPACTTTCYDPQDAGDLTCDGLVDIFDLTLVGSTWGWTPTSPEWAEKGERADACTADDLVELQDLNCVAQNFGATY